MTIPRSTSQVKYELLEENKRTAVKSSHMWLAVLLIILMICSSTIALYLTWQHMTKSSKEKDNLDFVVFGPTKSSSDNSWLSVRQEIYGEVVRSMSGASNILELTSKPDWPHTSSGRRDFRRVCYYNLPSSSVPQTLTPDMVPPDLCTHINIAFATIQDGLLQPNTPADFEVYNEVTNLKLSNPGLKVMLSVEWFTSVGEFAWVVSSAENRTRFVEGTVKFLEDNNLDGLDIDWEFPSWPTEVQNQTSCYTELLRQLSTRLRQRYPPFVLSAAVAAPKPIIDQSYNISAMAQFIDYVNVMAYDYHMYESYLPMTGANAPLYSRQAEKGYFTTLNLNWTTFYWLYNGMPADKIVIGIPTYGHSFTLMNEANHGWDAPSSGKGSVGIDGFTTYYEVCEFMRKGATAVFDFESKVPYAFLGSEWISFDNEQSVAYKSEYVKQHQLGGVMVYSLNTDDVAAACDGHSRFPLTQRINNVLQDDQL